MCNSVAYLRYCSERRAQNSPLPLSTQSVAKFVEVGANSIRRQMSANKSPNMYSTSSWGCKWCRNTVTNVSIVWRTLFELIWPHTCTQTHNNTHTISLGPVLVLEFYSLSSKETRFGGDYVYRYLSEYTVQMYIPLYVYTLGGSILCRRIQISVFSIFACKHFLNTCIFSLHIYLLINLLINTYKHTYETCFFIYEYASTRIHCLLHACTWICTDYESLKRAQ